MKDWRERRVWRWVKEERAALLLFFVSLALVQPLLMPALSEINPWDEVGYIQAGRLLLTEGSWTNLAGSPLMQAFFAAVILPFRASPFWLVQSTWLARPLLYALLWLGAILCAGELRRYLTPVIVAGLLLVSPLAAEMLSFPSDPLYAGLAALSLWQALRFARLGRPANAALASLFLGLSALARNDGLLLFPILVIWTAWAAPGGTERWRGTLAAALPFLLLVGGYVLAYGAGTGNFSLGTAERAYDNFETGQLTIAAGSISEIRQAARQAFGTPAENDYSILKAIQRNPRVYAQRVRAALGGLPEGAARAYGLHLALPLGLAALWGAAVLARAGEWKRLALLVLWAAPLASSLAITIFRTGHLRFPYAVVFLLAGIGIWDLLTQLAGRAGWAAVGLLALAGLAAGLAGKPAFVWSALVAALGVLGARAALRWNNAGPAAGEEEPAGDALLARSNARLNASQTAALLALLCAGLVLHGSFGAPRLPALGQSPDEQALLYLAQNYPSGTGVLTGAPGTVAAAGLQPGTLTAFDVPVFQTYEQFADWAGSQGFELIFVDHSLPADLLRLIEPQIGTGLERVFQSGQGDYQVLRFNPTGP